MHFTKADGIVYMISLILYLLLQMRQVMPYPQGLEDCNILPRSMVTETVHYKMILGIVVQNQQPFPEKFQISNHNKNKIKYSQGVSLGDSSVPDKFISVGAPLCRTFWPIISSLSKSCREGQKTQKMWPKLEFSQPLSTTIKSSAT